jgi:hypothetical protein
MTRRIVRRGLWWAGVLALLFAAPPSAEAADPTTADCVAANNSSIELRHENKLRAARGQLLICAADSCPSDIRLECLRHVDQVNTQIPTIIFEAKDAAGRDVSGVKVTMDGEPLADRLEGTALSVDPGEHAFVFEIAGQPTVVERLVISEAQKDRREPVTFGTAASPAVPPAQLFPSQRGGGLGAQKTVALVAAGIGVVGLAVGSVFGALTVSKKSDAQNACPNLCSDQHGVDLWNDAVSSGNVATAFFVVGGLGIAGGAALWFTAPSSGGAPAAQVGVGPGTLRLKGTW